MDKSEGKASLEKVDKGLGVVNLIYVVVSTIAIIILFIKAPNTIPTHYGFTKADAYGPKYMILIALLALIGTYIYFTFRSKSVKKGKRFYPLDMTKDKDKVYEEDKNKNGKLSIFMRVFCFFTMILISYFAIASLLEVKHMSEILPIAIIILALAFSYIAKKNNISTKIL